MMTPDRDTGIFFASVPLRAEPAAMWMVCGLVTTSSTGLSDDSLEFVDLGLGATEGTELDKNMLGFVLGETWHWWKSFTLFLASWK